ncbi:MAG: hypothetical protein EKK40_12270 [Bradyrhizobiaceae bacterium]|nr:MAG: hypothetical protein EKK40_12270 [Bradyrhizobiaceae bacterium]
MLRLVGSMVVAAVIIVFGYYSYLQPRPEQLACDDAIKASGNFGPTFTARSHTSKPSADGVVVNVVFSTTSANGDMLGNFYSCDLAKQADGSLKVTKVYPTPGEAK